MKKLLWIILMSMIACAIHAQTNSPVSWSFASKKLSADTYEVQMTASIEEEWHIYSQTTPKGGPIPTAINFTKNPLITLDGSTKETGKLEQRFEPLFGLEVKQYSDKVVFVQKLKIKGKVKTTLSGTVEFMTCNDHECMPPATKKFSVALQ